MIGAELAEAVARFRRVSRRALRGRAGPPPFGNAEIELIVALMDEPGQTVAAIAARLGLAPNTVSTLVTKAVAEGWLLRQVDPADRRAARLYPSDAAARRIHVWRDERAALVDRAVSLLPMREQRALVAALPALRRITEHIEHEMTFAEKGA